MEMSHFQKRSSQGPSGKRHHRNMCKQASPQPAGDEKKQGKILEQEMARKGPGQEEMGASTSMVPLTGGKSPIPRTARLRDPWGCQAGGA